ncbi:hypothetical protein M2459_000121 [Parabacteroides sp. PF5-5]|uniref:outer membrane beta-barrel family protein n=1 Tax=unclassified Parabacteroides TaxID=2649774 RepID=UPI002476454F|nr:MULTISPECIES: outer membrane beta-barrel family protein [unclassified Parabacteroides]MDH6303789.1 hypothetical protein [Parabacteroides sp. PH5-39]MDH6314406.1 hypothetical protein [Parabacteroides sp. PF5-13]MDH6318529.1 hypothetical protein [Parabacteroides sp. PH5-13]MDH6322178.1 hypothetical protein [Parabacteroides sp. PH5-8]MDH6325742.1 hypothetical protein [Parabacteroides sp. PH5-41]
MNKYTISFLFLLCSLVSSADGIKGRVVDSHKAAIDGVAVVLQTSDSVYVDAIVTDSLGSFVFQAARGNYILVFQHLLYEAKRLEVSDGDVGEIVLQEKDIELGEVVVRGERPQVKVSGGSLIYDTPQLIQNKPVSNAFEAIKELPGISGDDEKLELLGAGSLNIVINGQLTGMTLSQLIGLLKSIPASRVLSTEVMYSAPARYNVKGALINVVINQEVSQGESLQGEAGIEYRQRHQAWGLARGNVVYTTPRLSLDLLAEGQKGRAYGGEDMFARHTLGNSLVEVEQLNRSHGKPNIGSLRLGVDYTFANKDKLSASYYLQAGKSSTTRTSETTFNWLADNLIIPAFSTTTVDGNNTLQNAQLQYKGHQGLTAGVDFTHYRAPDHQHFVNNSVDSLTVDLHNNTRQEISRWMLFADHNHSFSGGWRLNYGFNLSHTSSDTWVEYLYNDRNGSNPSGKDSRSDNEQTEYGGNVFAEVSKTFGRFSATVSLKAEYFRSDYTSNGQKTVLWDDVALFPNASLSYNFSARHILQFNFSSDKTYPSYWSINPQTSYLNAYSVIKGNPSLKPSRSYDGQLLYIFRQKYILMLFANYEPDKFTQLPYQSPTELQNVFLFENLNYQLMSGVGIIVPLRLWKRLDSRITLQEIRMQEKNDHFYDIPFDNNCWFTNIRINNTLSISDSRPNLKLTLSGFYRTSAIQGIYKLGSAYDVSAGMKWLFANNKGSLSMTFNNIFSSNMPSYIRVNTGHQYSNMKNIDSSRYFSIAFSWKFGGYKEQKHDKPDATRFGK